MSCVRPLKGFGGVLRFNEKECTGELSEQVGTRSGLLGNASQPTTRMPSGRAHCPIPVDIPSFNHM